MLIKNLVKSIDIIQMSDANLLSKNVEDISMNSKEIKENSVFVAIKGVSFDPHIIADEIYASEKVVCFICEKPLKNVPFIQVKNIKTALAIICKNFFNIDTSSLIKVAVTGTNGKTTTSYLLESIFSILGNVIKIGTINYSICGHVLEASNTTPGIYEIFRIISEGIKKDANYLIMEVSSHAIDQERIAGLEFDASIFTNLTGDHLDYHKNMENYYLAKKKLFRKGVTKQAVINTTYPYGKRLYNEIFIPKLACSVNDTADVIPQKVTYSLSGSVVKIISENFQININSPLVGQHNLENIICAVSTAKVLGIEDDIIKRGIEALKFVPGRLERIESDGRYFFVDYAHTDDALKNVLKALIPYKKNRMITLFGCGGDRDMTKRPRMARAAEEYSDMVIVTSDNPRTEDPDSIISEVCKGFSDNGKIVKITDRRQAIYYAVKIAQKGDIVLLAGKGHEDYQIIGRQKTHFDDREEIKKALAGVTV